MRAVEFTAVIKDGFIQIPPNIGELKNGQSVKIIAMIETPAEDEMRKHLDMILLGVSEAKQGKGKKVRSIP